MGLSYFIQVLLLLLVVVLFPGQYILAQEKESAKKGFTQVGKMAMLKKHNDLRGSVQPTATNMEFMVWSDDLASLAQEWAEGCENVIGIPSRTPSQFLSVGKNLWASQVFTSAQNTIMDWYNELDFYTFLTVKCAEGQVCTHYRQIVWAQASVLGCGMSFCPTLKATSFDTGYMVVCYYAPGSPYQGDQPYNDGLPCSECPTQKPTCYQNLCGAVDKCGSLTCANGGQLDMETCMCTCTGEEWTGVRCDLMVPTSPPDVVCRGKTCDNGGTLTANCSCACAVGWESETCDQLSGGSDGTSGAVRPQWSGHVTLFWLLLLRVVRMLAVV